MKGIDLTAFNLYYYNTTFFLFCQQVFLKIFMFSKNLKDLRLKANLTQVQIAQELDITQQSYQKWESGKSKPTLNTLEMFSDFFDVSIEDLLSDGTVHIESILNADKISYKNQLLSDETVDLIKKTIKDSL